MTIRTIRHVAAVMSIGVFLGIAGFGTAHGINLVEVTSLDGVAPNTQDVSIPVKLTNDEYLRAIIVPLAVREVDGGAYITAIKGGWADRIGPGKPLGEITRILHYDTEDGTCKQGQAGGFGTITATDPPDKLPVSGSPYALLFAANRLIGDSLAPGSDVTGSCVLTVDVNDQTGCFEIDTACTNPANHLLFSVQQGTAIVPLYPDFIKGFVYIGDCDAATITSPDPATLSPPSGARGSDTVTFRWGAVGDPVGRYEIWVSEDENFGDTFFRTIVETDSVRVALIDYDTLGVPEVPERTVYWQVRGLNACGYCEGAGPWVPLTSPSIYTDVDEIAASAPVPDAYALGQNYPNPFNASTVIQYTNKTDGHVRLEIFNILGQSVVTLLDGYRPLGTHTITWDGTDAGGRAVPSGMYFYRLEAGDFSDVKKMALLK